jgi:hypothetical protein
MRFIFALGLAVCAAVPARAEIDYVTDTALCGLEYIDRSERGMTFNGAEFFEIEYFCEMSEPMLPVPGRDATHISAGYCEEPGALYPTVFVIRSFQSEPGTLYVYDSDNSEGTLFYSCGR